jgi:hypothetical protein
VEEFRAWQTPGGDDSSYTCADMKEMTASATQEHKNEVKLSAGLGGPLTRPNTAFWSPDRRTAVDAPQHQLPPRSSGDGQAVCDSGRSTAVHCSGKATNLNVEQDAVCIR